MKAVIYKYASEFLMIFVSACWSILVILIRNVFPEAEAKHLRKFDVEPVNMSLFSPSKQYDEAETFKQQAANSALPKTTNLTAKQRASLVSLLNSLLPAQFEQLVYALDPPPGILLPRSAPQGERTIEFLTWVESPTGRGFKILFEILKKLEIDCSLNQRVPYNSNFIIITLEGDLEEFTYETINTFVNKLREEVDDISISVEGLEEGSIKIILSGSTEGLENLNQKFNSGELSEAIGKSMLSIDFPIASEV
ncbi:MAG: hypothetical protein AAFY41_11315 [Bacteroidota bacterium]